MELPRVAGTVIESESGVWFVLYPPDPTDGNRWEWKSSGGDIFFTDFDSVRRVISYPDPWNVQRYGLDSSTHLSDSFIVV